MSVVCFGATLAYAGTAYHGFQRQAGETPTIQRMLERALSQLGAADPTVRAAGRTDRGVHAIGQVISFAIAWRHEDDELLRALNAQLPPDIALQQLWRVEGERFHPRFDARSRRYRYRLLLAAQRQPLGEAYAWRLRPPLDEGAMQDAARLLIGEHDFASFGTPPQGESTVREVYTSEWSGEGRLLGRILTYSVEANGFLQHMVRRIVSALVAVGRGQRSLAYIAEALRVAKGGAQRGLISQLAPPQGLFLEAVRYDAGRVPAWVGG
ncbi:MAG: tRNA pseudouridine(38-40) synthase TruA [Chloroflexi bacterium]|nr:tRNA pseudouridine(38-40) synthase TruA [Chloroflexota bacterium]